MEVEIVYNTEEQKEDVEELGKKYDSLTKNIYAVYDVFKEFFGSDRVDLQGLKSREEFISSYSSLLSNVANLHTDSEINDFCVLVWFPEVKVTNEYNKSITIYDLYARVSIDSLGRCTGLRMNKATYTVEQWKSRYIHSHLPRLNYDKPQLFNTPCLGLGPLLYTKEKLYGICSLDFWLLFCSELEDYVTVESLNGGPYIRMEEVGNYSPEDLHTQYYNASSLELNSYNLAGPISSMLNDFVKLLLKDPVPVEYANGSYSLGIPFIQFMLIISDKFINWFNQKGNPHRAKLGRTYLEENNIIKKYILRDNCLFLPDDSEDSLFTQNGKDMFMFKGTMIKLRIIGTDPDATAGVKLLHLDIVKGIASAILHVLNFKYGRNNEENSVFSGKTVYI